MNQYGYVILNSHCILGRKLPFLHFQDKNGSKISHHISVIIDPQEKLTPHTDLPLFHV